MSHAETICGRFAEFGRTRLEDCLAQIERCVGLLSDEQLWSRPNDVSNSIGNLVLHLTGNVRQWMLGGLGGMPVERDRPSEFAPRNSPERSRLMGDLRQTVEAACKLIGDLTPDALVRTLSIQGYETPATAAVFHVVEHFSLHTGQIVYATKMLTGRDLSLYDTEGRPLDPDRARAP